MPQAVPGTSCVFSPPVLTASFIRRVQGVVAGATENKRFLISSPVGTQGSVRGSWSERRKEMRRALLLSKSAALPSAGKVNSLLF